MAYKETKYIVYTTHLGGEVMIVFPSVVNHIDVARRLCGRDAVVSAGFLDIGVASDDEGVAYTAPNFHCYGESESLGGIKSRDEDSTLARQQLYGN